MEYTVVAVLLSVFTGLIWCQNVPDGKQFPLDINFGEDISGGHEGLFGLLGFSDNTNKEEKPGFNFANDKNYHDLLSELFPGLRYESSQPKQLQEAPKTQDIKQPQKVAIAPSKIVIIKPLPYAAKMKLQINPNLLRRGPNLFPGSVKEVPAPATELLPPPEHKINHIAVSPPQFKKDGQFKVENNLNIFDAIKNNSSQISENFGLKEEKFNFNQDNNVVGQSKENNDPLSYSSYLLSNEDELQKIFKQDNLLPNGFKQISDSEKNGNEKPKGDDSVANKHTQNNVNVNLDDLGEVLSILRINPDGTEESAILTNKNKNFNEIDFQKYLDEQDKLLQKENTLKPTHQNVGEEKIIENIRYVNPKESSNVDNKSKDKLNDDLVSSLEIVSNFFKNQDEFNKKVYTNAQNDYNQVLAKQSKQFFKTNEPRYDGYNDNSNSGGHVIQEKGDHQDPLATIPQGDNKDIFFINDEGLGKIAADPNDKQKGFIVYFSDPKSNQGKSEQATLNRSGGSATSYSRVSLPGRNYNNNLEH